jgi:hypothetical protein
MIEFETAVRDRLAALRAAAATLRHERTAAVVDGRMGWRTRMRVRLGRQLVLLGTWLLQGPVARGPRDAIAAGR